MEASNFTSAPLSWLGLGYGQLGQLHMADYLAAYGAFGWAMPEVTSLPFVWGNAKR